MLTTPPPPAASAPFHVAFTYLKPGVPLMMVSVRVNGKGPLAFIVDTGNAGQFLLSEAAAHKVGAVVDAAGATVSPYAVGAGVDRTIRPARVESVAIGARRLGATEVGVTRMLDDLGERLHATIDGNVGYDFMRHYAVTVDYRAMEIQFGTDPPATAHGGEPFTLGRKPIILLQARVNGSHTARFALDTGAGATALSTALAATLKLPHEGSLGVIGGGGGAAGYRSTVGDLAVGGIATGPMPVVVADFFAPLAAALGEQVDGVIGHDLLSRHRLVIDYPRGRLYLLAP